MLASINADLAASKQVRVGLVLALRRAHHLIVSVSIKWVGILIINSLLVLPAAAAALNLARSMRLLPRAGGGFSVCSGISGLILSYYLGTAAGNHQLLISAGLFSSPFH